MPSYSIGFWVATTKNGSGSGCGVAVDGHLVLLHRLEQRGLRLRRRAVDLVGEQHVGEHRPGRERELAGPQRHRPGEVRREHVRRELHAPERHAERTRHRVREQRLRDAGHAFEQHVTLRPRLPRAPGRSPRPGRRPPCGPPRQRGLAAPSRCSLLGPGQRGARGQDALIVGRGRVQSVDLRRAPAFTRCRGTDVVRARVGGDAGSASEMLARRSLHRRDRLGRAPGARERPRRPRRRTRVAAAEGAGRSPRRVRSGATPRSASGARRARRRRARPSIGPGSRRGRTANRIRAALRGTPRVACCRPPARAPNAAFSGLVETTVLQR